MLSKRRQTRQLKVASLGIGSDSPVLVQSMANTDTADTGKTVAQIERLQACGCELVRVAVPSLKVSKTLSELVKRSPLPLVADIHFDYRLALAALDAGVAKLRLNPGNIGSREKIAEVVKLAGSLNVPIRIGVNSGSLEKDLLDKFGGPTAEALAESALRHVKILEDLYFREIIVSIKASDVEVTVKANRIFASQTDYPVHLGVTEAGTRLRGAVMSSLGIGILLAEGIGDTIRVSLTARPEDEIDIAYKILSGIGIRRRGVELISCPSCGRTQVDIISLAEEAERRLSAIDKPLKVAVMGCIVNGPGEAREADYGIAAGKGGGLLFSKGEIIDKLPEDKLVDGLIKLIAESEGIGNLG